MLSFGTNRALREKVWRAFVNRGDNGNANDTNAIIAKIVKLRADRAKLLGYAEPRRLADAGHDGQVAGQGDGPDDARLAGRGGAGQRGSRRHEAARGQGRRRDRSSRGTIAIYQEKVRKAKYDLSQDEIKPYFELSTWSRACSGRPGSSTT